MKLGSKIRNFASYILLFSMVTAMLCSCTRVESDFPDIPVPTSETTVSNIEETIVNEIDSNYRLSFALPYSEKTALYLFKYYYAKTNGLVGDDSNGSTIDLDFLDSIQIPYAIDYYYVPNTGSTAQSIVDMSNQVPDLFLTSELDVCINEGICTSLNSYVYDNDLINVSNIDYEVLSSCMINEVLYGVPHYLSVPVIYGNVDYIPSEYLNKTKISLNDLNDILELIKDNSSEEVVPFSNVKDLAPYIGSAFGNSLDTSSYMLYDEYLNSKNLFDDRIESIDDYITGLYEEEFSINANEDGSNPVYSRNSALWIGSSTDISSYNSYYPDKLCYFMIPTFKDSSESVPYVTVYPLCVSSTSASADVVSDFALFISLDKDALLLINRLEYKVGMLPVISNPVVWDSIIVDDDFGYLASLYETEMSNSICSLNIINSSLYSDIQSYLVNCYSDLESDEINLDGIYD